MAKVRFDASKIPENARVLDRNRIDVPLDQVLPLIRGQTGFVEAYGEVEEAQEKSPGSNLFLLSGSTVYALQVPEEKLPRTMPAQKQANAARTAFESVYRIVRVPKDPETRALIGWQSGVCDFDKMKFWMEFFRDRLVEVSRGDMRNFDVGGDGEEVVKRALSPAFGEETTQRLLRMRRVRSSEMDLSVPLNYQAMVFQIARDVVTEFLTDGDALKQVYSEYQDVNSFWSGVPGMETVLPARIAFISTALSTQGGQQIVGEMEKIQATLIEAGIPYTRYEIKTMHDRWPKDMRTWSVDNTFCIEPLDYGGKEAAVLEESSAWKATMSIRVLLSRGGSAIHGVGATPYVIVAEGANALEVEGFLDVVGGFPGYEDVRAYQFHPGFIKWSRGGSVLPYQSSDIDMNLDTFNASDTHHGRPGIWIDPSYRRALERTPEFQRFMREQGDSIVVVESDPSETHLHPQNTSKVTAETKLVNKCPKSLALLRPMEGRYLVLREPVQDLILLDGGVGCNTGMVLMKRTE